MTRVHTHGVAVARPLLRRGGLDDGVIELDHYGVAQLVCYSHQRCLLGQPDRDLEAK